MSTNVRQQFQLPTQRGNSRGESLYRRNLIMLDPTSEPEPNRQVVHRIGVTGLDCPLIPDDGIVEPERGATASVCSNVQELKMDDSGLRVTLVDQNLTENKVPRRRSDVVAGVEQLR
ncbi:hypothetical protein [Nocardia fusca]|uniref:Uncharacterized protein n=1 Tax=Nocardia fusca TaxID=941183 RepID=A0ABV3F5T6_9NOCA